MPYVDVEVWVDEMEFDREQLEAIADLVRCAKEIAGRQWPSDDAAMLDRTAQRVARIVMLPGDPQQQTLFPADGKYRAWKEERDRAAASGAGRAA